MLLEGKRVLVTGVLTSSSIAWAVADAAQREGAEVMLTSFGRGRRLTERAGRMLRRPADVLELDVTSEDDHAALHAALLERWGGVDCALHSIAFGPPDVCGGGVINASDESLHTAFEASVFSFQRLAQTLGPLMSGPGYGSLVGLDMRAQPGWVGYDWMGIAKTALRDLTRYLACELGGHGIRCNLVSSGPLQTVASDAMPGWERVQASFPPNAPLGWDLADARPVADAVVFLFSDLARAVTGEVVHADGGIHALGGFSPIPGARRGRAQFNRLPGQEPAPFDPMAAVEVF